MRKKQKIIGVILILILVGLLILVHHPRVDEDPGVIQSNSSRFDAERLDPRLRGDDVIVSRDDVIESANDVVESKKATLQFADETFEFSVSSHTTVYDAMNNLMAEGKLNFEGKEYPGLGFFVTSIGSLESGDGKNLMYYINGKEASLGVSSYVIKEGDIIEWKLK